MRTAAGNRTFLALMGALILLAWLTLWAWEHSPYSRYLQHGLWGQTTHVGLSAHSHGLSAILYLVGWTLMTAAMMLPSTLPLIEIFRRLTIRKKNHLQLVALVIAGYLIVWAGFGIVAHLSDWGLYQLLGRFPWVQSNGWVLGVGILVLAGEISLFGQMSCTLELCHAILARKTRSIALLYARSTSRNFLRGLLLGPDAFDVRCWYRKHWLDAGLRSGDGH
jgi:predicted metal-binding membrane protein